MEKTLDNVNEEHMNSITIIIILIMSFLFCGCESKTDEAKKELQQLNNKIIDCRRELRDLSKRSQDIYMRESVQRYRSNINLLTLEKEILQKEIDKLNKDINIKRASLEGRNIYILTIELKQSHISLDIGKHIKDAMNTVEFQFPTNEEFYNSVEEGQEIFEKFRSGSFWMEGSFGDWNITVIKKEIRNTNR